MNLRQVSRHLKFIRPRVAVIANPTFALLRIRISMLARDRIEPCGKVGHGHYYDISKQYVVAKLCENHLEFTFDKNDLYDSIEDCNEKTFSWCMNAGELRFLIRFNLPRDEFARLLANNDYQGLSRHVLSLHSISSNINYLASDRNAIEHVRPHTGR